VSKTTVDFLTVWKIQTYGVSLMSLNETFRMNLLQKYLL